MGGRFNTEGKWVDGRGKKISRYGMWINFMKSGVKQYLYCSEWQGTNFNSTFMGLVEQDSMEFYIL